MWEDLKSPAFKEGLIFLDTFGLSPEGAPENKLQRLQTCSCRPIRYFWTLFWDENLQLFTFISGHFS